MSRLSWAKDKVRRTKTQQDDGGISSPKKDVFELNAALMAERRIHLELIKSLRAENNEMRAANKTWAKEYLKLKKELINGNHRS